MTDKSLAAQTQLLCHKCKKKERRKLARVSDHRAPTQISQVLPVSPFPHLPQCVPGRPSPSHFALILILMLGGSSLCSQSSLSSSCHRFHTMFESFETLPSRRDSFCRFVSCTCLLPISCRSPALPQRILDSHLVTEAHWTHCRVS